MACIEDEMCNRKIVPFVQACSADQCKPHQCRQAMGHFYSTLPHNRAEAMVFCECDREDQECQQMKDSLHSGSCVTDESQTPWTCLEMLDSCSGDVLCRLVSNLVGNACTKCMFLKCYHVFWINIICLEKVFNYGCGISSERNVQ